MTVLSRPLRTTSHLLFATVLALAVGCGSTDTDDDDLIAPRDGGALQDGGDRDAGADRDGGVGDDGGAPDGGDPFSGPIDAPFDTWTWVEVPESRCLNNTATGFGVNIHEGADKVMIIMAGGNACFNDSSCGVTANRDGYGATKFTRESANLNGGLFDRVAQENYFKEWSYVVVPYCSGDVYSGTTGQTTVQNGSYYFNGYNNVGLFLDRIVPTFPGATKVLLTGQSAGGFGALLNFDRTQRAFGLTVDVTLIDDSGPPMGNSYLAPCLQDHWRTLWGMSDGPLSLCNDCTDTDGSFVTGYLDHIKATYPTNRLGVVSSNADDVIRGFFGFGNNNCANLNAFIPPAYPAAQFQMGLEDFRDNLVGDTDNIRLYMPTSTRHVWSNSALWTVTHSGVNLQDWYIAAIEGNAGWGDVP